MTQVNQHHKQSTLSRCVNNLLVPLMESLLRVDTDILIVVNDDVFLRGQVVAFPVLDEPEIIVLIVEPDVCGTSTLEELHHLIGVGTIRQKLDSFNGFRTG